MGIINFAERIRRAILPSFEEMRAVLPEHFILYRSGVVIPGDIYWFSRREDKIFLAAVDCTGHGIGGALLSMFGAWALDKLVWERHLSDPALVLQGLHRDVCRALKEEERTGCLSGMEVALCVIEKDKNKIAFAGARRPLYLVRFPPSPTAPKKQDTELIEIGGDRKPVAGRHKDRERVFSRREIDVLPGDMIYLTTDGFVDQNNREDQKYGAKRLKAFLPTAAGLPVSMQENYFERELRAFMGEEEQRDDITVIGVRL